jgi:hypothetical protein
MPIQRVSFTGQNATTNANGTGSFNTTFATQNDLFLKVFAGEVLQAFETATVMKDKHTVRTITSGKSAQFPVTGIASAQYHRPGTDIMTETGHDNDPAGGDQSTPYSTSFAHAERVINVDDLLIATTFIDKLDEAKNHYDVRSIYSSELGRALARQMDRNLIGVALLSAATYNSGTGVPTAVAGLAGNPSGTIVGKNFTLSSGSLPSTGSEISDFVDAAFEMAAAFDTKNVPAEDRYLVLTPTSYYNLINSDAGRRLINRDFGGNGSYNAANLGMLAGFELVKSNNAPAVFANLTATTQIGSNNTYRANFSKVAAAAFHKSAFGTVKLMDMAMETDYDIRLQGHLMVAKYAMGHGTLRAECAGVIFDNV